MTSQNAAGNEGSQPTFTKPTYPPLSREPSNTIRRSTPSPPPCSPITPSASLARLAQASAPVHPPLPQHLDGARDGVSPTTTTGNDQHSGISQQPQVKPESSGMNGQMSAQSDQQASTSLQMADPQTSDTLDARFMAPPQPVPFEQSENTDVLAMRAAIGILNHQKKKSEQDIHTLENLKRRLREDPEAFVEALTSGKLRQEKDTLNALHATFSRSGDDDEDMEDNASRSPGMNGAAKEYPRIPQKQNLIRCPPVNWAKYHIVGEPLDKMHEEQRRRPTQGESSRGPIPQSGNPYYTPTDGPAGPPADEYHLYKPYDPLTDGQDMRTGLQRDGVQTRRSSKK